MASEPNQAPTSSSPPQTSESGGCVNCGNDDGNYKVCLDCLETIGDPVHEG